VRRPPRAHWPCSGTPRTSSPTEPTTTPPPDWFTWFSVTRLRAFKGHTELTGRPLPQARTTLERSSTRCLAADGKQRVVILGDLAMPSKPAPGNVEAACALLEQALDQLAVTWYATGIDRVRDARRAL
jgi:hypothetical protein